MTKTILFLLFITLFFSCGVKDDSEITQETQEVNIYSHRHYEADKSLYEEFTKQTGIEVNVVKAGADELMERLKNEGENTKADLLITVDAGRLYRAKEEGLLQSVKSEILDNSVPKMYRDPDNQWFGITKRARILVYNPEKVNPEELSTYEDLSNDKWKGRILVRSSSNIYNQSLIAALVAHYPEGETAQNWVSKVRANFARDPKGNDRDQIKAVAAGVGDLAIVNTYYFGLLADSEDNAEKDIAENLKVFFPTFENGGSHINISGVGVTKHSPNKENAIKLIEFLLSEESQKVYSEANFEYPINPNVESSDFLKSLGEFKEDKVDVYLFGQYNSKAVELFDKAGWE